MNIKVLFQHKWRLFLLIIVIPALFVGLIHEYVSRKDAQINGEVVEVKIKSISCRGKKGAMVWFTYNNKSYSTVWSCSRKEKEGEIMNAKYSKKYDTIVTMGYRSCLVCHIIFCVFTIGFFLMVLHDTRKRIRQSKEINNLIINE